nr:hypothetical protein BaRGS_026299 [Batillaria attramentaria]
MVFKTVHQLDMAFLEVTKTAEYHLGYTTDEICQKSWYSMLHPEDIHEAREKHILLIRSSHEMGCMMTVRMLNAEGQVLWVNIVMHVRQAAATTSTHNDDPLIVCINQIISEEEAYQIKLQSHMFALYPPRSGELWAAGLQGTGHAPHTQTDASTRWIPATAGMSPPAAGGSYQAPVTSYYVGGQQRAPLPACAVNYQVHDRAGGYQIATSSPPAPSQTQVQTDKLKIMLKRKIQGPCRPAKVPKLAWDEHADSNGNSGGLGFEYAATADPMHSPTSASQFLVGGTTSSFGSWSPGASVPHTAVKTEVEHKTTTITSAAILQELEKLASLSRAETTVENTITTATRAVGGFTVKREPTEESACRHACRQRELPIMDAFDIESFFDTLIGGEAASGIASQVQQQQMHAARQSAAHVQTAPQTDAKKRPQAEMDTAELEELLSFFSGDMTATQLDLADGLVTSYNDHDVTMTNKDEGDALVESVKAFADSLEQETVVCGAGHLGAFLLHPDSLERQPEEFSPVSTTSSDVVSDVNSDMSGDEESSCAEDLAGEFLMLPGQPIKRESGERRGQVPTPLHPNSRRGPAPPHTPQDVPGLNEEDELYQLDKLLSSIVPDDGFLSEETQ